MVLIGLLCFLCLMFAGLSIFFYRQYSSANKTTESIKQELIKYETYKAVSESQISALKEQNFALKELEQELQQAILFLEKKLSKTEEALNIKDDLYKQTEAKKQEMKEIFLSQAKNTVNEIAEKLLKETDEKNKYLNDEFLKSFNDIQQKFTIVRDYLQQDRKDIKLIKQSFVSSNSTGFHGELHLANSLSGLGLMENIDFFVQFSMQSRLRPDCVIFLPNNNIFVIDSKSSTYFLEKDESTDTEEQILRKISERMNQHLTSLTSKSYQEEIRKELTSKGKEINNTYLFMFVPSEVFIEKIIKADPSFNIKAREKGIILCGPNSLQYILQIAKENIDNYKIDAQYREVVSMIQELLGRFSVLAGYAQDLAQNINKVNQSLNKFSGSFNRNLLPQAKKIIKVIDLPNGKSLPEKIPEMGLNIIEEV